MKRYVLFIIGLFFSFVSCVKDNTSFGDNEVLTVDTLYLVNLKTGVKSQLFQGRSAGFTMNPGEEIQIAVHGIYEGDEKPRYHWCLLDGTEIFVGDTLQHVFTTEELGGESGIIILYAYRGEQEAANVFEVSFTINNLFAMGLVVLAKENGQFMLDFCPRQMELRQMEYFDGQKYDIKFNYYSMLTDVFGSYNAGEVLGLTSPLNMSYASGAYIYSLPDPLRAIYLLDKDWKNSIAVDLNGMKKLVSLGEEFLEMPEDANMAARDFKTIGAMSLLQLEDGKIYTRVNYDRGNPCTGKFLPIPLLYHDPNAADKDAEVILATRMYQKNGNNWCVIFEEEKQRFLLVSASDGNTGSWYAPIDYCAVFDFNNPSQIYPEGAIPMNHFDKEIRAAFIDPLYGTKLYIIYEESGEYYLQECNLYLSAYSVEHSFSFRVDKAPMKLSGFTTQLLQRKSCVVKEASLSTEAAVFLTEGNRIYILNLSSGDSEFFMEIEEEKGNDIIMIESLWPWMTLGSWNEYDCYFQGRFFAVAFSNGDFKIIRQYDDLRDPNGIHYEVVVEKHYDGGVINILSY